MLHYYVNESNDPYFNQAFEEYVFRNTPYDDVLLLWRSRPAVVCGCYQNLLCEVHLPTAMARGVAIVRRETGGGAVYHDLGNVNYTRICRCADRQADYARFIQPVVEALRRMGIDARMNRTCDIAIGGEKISGSAQKIAGGRVLHHGTLLYDADLQALRLLANGARGHYTTRGVASVPQPVTNIAAHWNEKMPAEAFARQLLQELAGPDAQRAALDDAALVEIARLGREKYAAWQWTYGKTPAFEFENEAVFAGTPVTVRYAAKHGVILQIACENAPPALRALEQRLRGCALDPAVLEPLCRSVGDAEFWKFLF
mgnify:CR=1 FL=1